MNIELHIVQNFAPSCLNRDDTNSPKTCTFGGTLRARISSQCFKRAIRLHMKEALGVPTGVRTRCLAGVPELLAERGLPADDAALRTARALQAAGFVVEDGRTKVGLYLADDEIARLADAVAADWDALGEEPGATEGASTRRRGKGKAAGVEAPHVVEVIKALGQRVRSADIALYGRMMAENTNMNIDAACQVAHAVSTHTIETDFDFFTAVDDLQPDEETGAGMMGHQEFNSACFYRYALIQTGQLVANLNGDVDLARRAVEGFVRAAVDAIPSAKQNSHAAQNPPSYVQVIVGADLPRSLANAFERPVTAGYGESLVANSVAALLDYQRRLEATYDQVRHGEARCLSLVDGVPGVSLSELLAWLKTQLTEIG